MLQPSDVLMLLALHEVEGDWTLRSLAERLGVQHSKVQRGLQRLAAAGIYDSNRRRLVPHTTEEFLLHALRYLHPIQEGALVRGFPTAWGALPLSAEIHSSEAPPVWPDPHGTARGPAVKPLDAVLPRLVDGWPEVAQLAAITDGLRLGDARTREAATRLLRDALAAAPV